MMIEAVVGVALRAILASIILGSVLAALVLVATRTLSLTASSRHALWTTALIATALMPLAGIGVSIARATAATPAAAPSSGTLAPSSGTLAPSSGTLAPSSGTLASSSLPKTNAPSQTHAPSSQTHASSSQPHASHATAQRGASESSESSGSSGSYDEGRAAKGASVSGRAHPAAAPGASLLDRLAVTRWTPRMSRNLAIGVVGVWLLGALIGLIGLAASIVRVRGLKRRSSPLDGTLADELPWLTEAGPGREIYLRLSFETETPVAIGFRRPVILIPTELATADGLSAIEQLILHEHAHLRRYDDWTNLVQRVIERLFWFNPIVWLVGRRIALEREIASDDAVVEKTGEAHAYATSLWKLAREMRMPEHAVVAPGALLTRKQITVRIEQLLDKRRAQLHRSPLAALGIAAASVLAVAIVATSAPAVELPALTEASSTATTAATGATTAATGATTAATGANAAATGANAAAHGAAKSIAPGHAHAAQRLAAHADTQTDPRSTRIAVLEPKTVNFQIVAMPTVAPRSYAADGAGGGAATSRAAVAHAAHVAALDHDRAASEVAARETGSRESRSREVATRDRGASGGALSGSSASSGAAASAAGAAAPAPLPAPIAAPLTGALPLSAPPRPPELPVASRRYVLFPRNAPALTQEQIAKLPATAEGTAAHFKSVHDPAEVGPEVAKALKSVMSSLPAQIAQESSWSNRTKLAGVKLSRELVASCMACSMRGADLRGVDLHGLNLNGDDLSGADMRGVNLAGAQLIGVSLRGANLSGADLRNTELNGVDLRDANFDSAQLEGVKLIGVSLQHVSLRGTTLRSVLANCMGCALGRLDLHGQDLHGISLNGVDLSHTDLHDANLSGVRFNGVDLSNANLTRANLSNARFDGCNLAGVELHGARTTGMTVTGSSGLDG